MRVVGLSGAQGGGKSSLLIELEQRGWKLDKFRVSRAVQAQLGWDNLDKVMESWDTMRHFQEEVFKQKFEHDYQLSQEPGARTIDEKGHVILTERTFADIVAYTNMWTWRHVDRKNVTLDAAVKWLHGYTTGCAHAQRQIYSATILLPYMAEVIQWEADPNRASRSDVDAVFEDVERFLERKVPLDTPRLRITTRSVADRATQVEAFLRTL